MSHRRAGERPDRTAPENPGRTSAVNASPVVDAQSTYETAFALQAAILSHSI